MSSSVMPSARQPVALALAAMLPAASAGYEPTAVLATMGSLKQSLRALSGG